jgi:hypothetical protein
LSPFDDSIPDSPRVPPQDSCASRKSFSCPWEDCGVYDRREQLYWQRASIDCAQWHCIKFDGTDEWTPCNKQAVV